MLLKNLLLSFLILASCGHTDASKKSINKKPEQQISSGFGLDDPLGDLDVMKKTIEENHPGMFNKLDPDFKKNMDAAYVIAKAQLQNTTNHAEQNNVLRTFVKSFDDVHLGISILHPSSVQSPSPQKEIKHFTLEILKDGRIWITLPTFHELTKEQEDELRAISESLPQYRTSPGIIFDIRGNGGGNSEIGTAIVRRLFGEEYFDPKRMNVIENEYMDWRASDANIQHMENFKTAELAAAKANRRPVQKELIDWVDTILKGTKESRENHSTFFRELAVPNPPSAVSTVASPVKAKIFAIINKGNGSAALDFLDDLKIADPEAIFIGETTLADRLYMDINRMTLPSGRLFWFPMKVFRNRPRGDKVPYMPEVPFVEGLQDTNAVKQFFQRQFPLQQE